MSELYEYSFEEVRRQAGDFRHPADLAAKLTLVGLQVVRIKNNTFCTDATIDQIKGVLNGTYPE
jgi:hypothetical protein